MSKSWVTGSAGKAVLSLTRWSVVDPDAATEANERGWLVVVVGRVGWGMFWVVGRTGWISMLPLSMEYTVTCVFHELEMGAAVSSNPGRKTIDASISRCSPQRQSITTVHGIRKTSRGEGAASLQSTQAESES